MVNNKIKYYKTELQNNRQTIICSYNFKKLQKNKCIFIKNQWHNFTKIKT